MLATADTFSHTHIAETAATTALISAAIGIWRLTGRYRIGTGLAVGVLSGIAVYLWRASANMPQLNNDGLSGYSANDWLAPVIVFVVLSIYADLIPTSAASDKSEPPRRAWPLPSTSSPSDPDSRDRAVCAP